MFDRADSGFYRHSGPTSAGTDAWLRSWHDAMFEMVFR